MRSQTVATELIYMGEFGIAFNAPASDYRIISATTGVW